MALSVEEARAVVARAEFRVFGRDVIALVEPRLWNGRTVLQQARQMPPETYLLSRLTNEANVKVRDGLLDIKLRSGVTSQGYEIFQPAGKFQFPVTHQQLTLITTALHVAWPEEAGSWTIEAFISAARRHPHLAVVTVEKLRYGFVIDGVTCEYARVWFNGAMVETACVESDDHARMAAVIETLGLAGRPNVNYLRAAKRVLGLEDA